MGGGKRWSGGTCKHCFQYRISVYQLVVYPMIGQLWQIFSTLISIIWLYMCSLTNLLSKKPYTTPLVLFDICHLGGVVGGLSYLKRCLQVLLFSLPAVLSCLLIHCLLTFSLFHTAQEPGSGWSFQWWLFIETSIGDWVGRGERAECKDLGKCKNTSCVSPLLSPLSFPALTPFSIAKF